MAQQEGNQQGEAGTAAKGWRAWLGLVAEEPFRLLFPLGILVSVAGVLLWPLLYGGWLTFYPGVAHARLMMGGFVGAFSLGFLGTALPRMISAPHLRGWEWCVILVFYLTAVGGYIAGFIQLGDGGMLAALLFFFLVMMKRLVKDRQDVPPPGFVMVALGWLAALLGLFLFLLEGEGEAGMVMTGARHQLAGLLFYQGFILLPILGIGGFLFPRFVGLKTLQMFDESRTPPVGWSKKAVGALVVGLMVLVSFWMEVMTWVLAAGLLRCAAVAWYVWGDVLIFRKAKSKGALAFGLRAGLLLLLAAFPLAAFLPAYRVGVDHMIFISGFGLIALMVATRVTLGHSGNSDLFAKKMIVMRVVIGSVLLAMATRVTAEFVPVIRVSHLNYAALCWSVAALLWLGWIGRRFFQWED